jgi:predicted RNase H-like nuclease (RuvC/YqgF family)
MPQKPIKVADRLDRIEAAIERMAEEHNRFAAEQTRFASNVRGAIMAQQAQIAELTKAVGQHDKVIQNLERQFEAYLRRLPSQ